MVILMGWDKVERGRKVWDFTDVMGTATYLLTKQR